MKDWQLSSAIPLWLVLISGCLSTIAMQPGWAEVKLGSGELAVESRDSKPILTPKIRNLTEIELPSTSAQMLVQSPAPQNPPLEGGKQGGEIVPITGVKANPTDKGVEVILQTSLGKQLQVINRSTGNSFIVDIPNAQLRLPSGEAFTFRSEKPLAGITEITVTNFNNNTIRLTAIGEASLPTVELFDDNAGLVFGISSQATATSPQQSPQTPQANQPQNQAQPSQPSAQDDQPIELVVTGEQDGYRVPNATTGTRTDTPIRDIPQSIQVIPRQVLEDQRITRPREAIQNVSGVTPGALGSQSVVGESLIFRGFAENGVTSSTFVNGFRRYFGSRTSDTANVEQLEILKGLASVLYGQGEPGGILNITTKQPLSNPYYAVDATIGSFDFYRPTLDISGLLNADSTIRYRLNAAYENSGSYVDFVESEKVFIAPVISFELGKNTTLTLEGEYTNVSKVEYFGIPAVGSVIKSPFGKIPRSQYLDVSDFDLKLNRYAIGYRLQHRFSDIWSIRNGFRAELESYEESYLFPSLRPDNRSVNRTGGFDKIDSENYVLQTDVLGSIQTGSVKQDLLFGVELSRNDLIADRFSIALPPIDIFNPNRSLPPLERIPTVYRNEPQNFIGVYAQDLISIGDNLKILLGGRFDYAAGCYIKSRQV